VVALVVLAGTPVWAVKSLGAPPGHAGGYFEVQGMFVNAQGTAVASASSSLDPGVNLAFVWQNGKKTALTYRRVREIEPVAIDSVGDVIGSAGKTAVLWRKGVPSALGSFQPNAMSDNGAFVVGVRNTERGSDAVLWREGSLTALPGLGGTQTSAAAVNRYGVVVGSSMLRSAVYRAVVWHRGKPTDLGSVHGLDSYATLITPSGTIFGYASYGAAGPTVVLEWKSGQLIDLGRFGAAGAQPVAVNAQGNALVQTVQSDGTPVGLRLLRGNATIQITVPALGHQSLYGVGLDDEDDVGGYGAATLRGFLWRDSHATLLPAGYQPEFAGPNAVAGGWIIASNLSGIGVAALFRLHH
jgi:uncharacterized membrane protein